MAHKPLALRVALIAGFAALQIQIVAVVAVVMWESRRDFQGVWEGWQAGIVAFHTPAFPWLVF